jgi:hypothetical protein
MIMGARPDARNARSTGHDALLSFLRKEEDQSSAQFECKRMLGRLPVNFVWIFGLSERVITSFEPTGP